MFFEKNYFTDTENFVDKNKRLKQQLAVNMETVSYSAAK